SERRLDDWIRCICESVMLVRHGDVNDGQLHADISLQYCDKAIEDRPADVHDAAGYRAPDSARRQEPEQQEYDFACVHVAVQPQRMRQWLRDVFDQVEKKVERDQQRRRPQRLDTEGRAEQLLDPTAEAFVLDAVEDHEAKN